MPTTKPAQNQPTVTEAHRILGRDILNIDAPPHPLTTWAIDAAADKIAAAEARTVEVATKELRDELEKAKRMNRESYDAATAYMEISTKVRGENDALTAKLALAKRDSRWRIEQQSKAIRLCAEFMSEAVSDMQKKLGYRAQPEIAAQLADLATKRFAEFFDAAMQPEGGK